MKSSILKNGCLAIALTTAFASHAIRLNPNYKTISNLTIKKDIIRISITKSTSDSEFKEIINVLKKHNIEGTFTNIKRNKKGEIIALKINLKDNNGNASSTALKSDNPIDDITVGSKHGNLFITSKNSHSFSFNGTHSESKEFDFSFEEDENSLTINGKKINFDEIGEKIKGAFNIEEDENGKRMVIKLNNFDFTFDDNDSNQIKKHQYQKFHFVDDPTIEKYIIIDGKKSDFKKLDKLAKANQLQSVDFLKPDTAQSIYGIKGKDGAIIATTKK